MKQAISCAIISLSVALSSSISFGWGQTGHRTTGQIAEAYLTPQARAGITQILNGPAKIADVATWADGIKQQPGMAHCSPYHYDSIPDGVTYLQSLKAQSPQTQANGGVVEGILAAEKVLRTPNMAIQDRNAALKFLIHFIGDLHQPLHTGRAGDRGGNDVHLKWFNQASNLHSVWDTGIINAAHQDIFGNQPQNSDVSVIYARYLIQKFGNQPPPQNSWGSVETWLAESVNARILAYDPLINRDQNAYVAKAGPVVDRAVYNAGMRIADTLNRLFAGQPMLPQDQTLYSNIESIVGDLLKIITLGPRANDGYRFADGGGNGTLAFADAQAEHDHQH